MAKQEILNLDKFVPEPRIIILEGKEYKVASDISVGDALKIMNRWSDFQDSAQGGTAEIDQILEQIWKFFEPYNPDLTKEELKSKIKVKHIGPLVEWLYKGIMEFSSGQEEEVEEEDSKKKEAQASE